MVKDEHEPTNAPKVLVLLATYNGARWLDEQLRSIFTQGGVQVTLLAGDDHSSDDTLEVLQRWARSSPGSMSRLPTAVARLGAAGNFIRLLREASLEGMDFVALADQDDIWLPDRLARATQTLRAQGAQGYSSDVLAFWADGRRKSLGKAHPQRAHDHLFEPAGPGCTYVMEVALARALQREFAREPGRFEGIGYHDWLIYAYARLHGYRWFIDPEAGVLYRQHGQNELGANAGVAGVRRRFARLTSGWFRGQIVHICSLWPEAPQSLLARLRRMAFTDRLWLAAHARDLRRRPLDQLALAAMLLLGVLR